MEKARIAEDLAETLQTYVEEVEDGDRHNFYDDHIVDQVLEMHKILYKDGVEEGRKYSGHMLVTDKPVQLFDILEMEKALSGKRVKIQVMSIINVKPLSEGRLSVELLGAEVE